MESLLKILMKRDDLTEAEAQEIIDDAKQQVRDGENPEDVLYEMGLEPDYFDELL